MPSQVVRFDKRRRLRFEPSALEVVVAPRAPPIRGRWRRELPDFLASGAWSIILELMLGQSALMGRLLILVGVACAALATQSASGATATFTPVGLLTGTGGSTASDVSDDGSTVVGSSLGQGVQGGGWMWTAATGMVKIDGPTGMPYTGALGVSANGNVIVGADQDVASPYYAHAFQWTSASGSINLPNLPGGIQSLASAVSSDGNAITGQAGSAAHIHGEAFVWTNAGGIVGLGTLPGDSESSGLGISADGSTIVGNSDSHAFRWTAATGMVQLPFLPGASSGYATCVNGDGSVVDGSMTTNGGRSYEAFRWTQQTGTVDLGRLPGMGGSEAGGISSNGTMIVGTSGHAFLWTAATGMLDLQSVLIANGATGLDGWTLTTANNISSDGRFIVGDGIDPSGDREAWLATLPSFSPGDVNLDGVVNGLDISQVASHWLQAGVGTPGDANADGVVNGLDIALMASHWLHAASSADVQMVPEPSTLLLATIGGLTARVLRRRLQRPRFADCSAIRLSLFR